MKEPKKVREDLEVALNFAFEKNDVGHLEQTAIYCELFISKVFSMVSSMESRRRMIEELTENLLERLEARDGEDAKKTDEVVPEAKSE